MQEQKQIEKQNQNQYNEEDEEADMKEFVKGMKDMRQRMNFDTNHVQEQDKRFVNVNDKLDDYNKEVKKGDEYMDIINKSPFSYVKDKFTGLFKRKKEKKLDKHDKQVIEKARNKQIDNKNNDFEDIKKDEQKNKINNKDDDEDDIYREALEEAKGMRKAVKEFTSAVKDSSEVVDVTNKNMDNSIHNVNQVSNKMKKNK
jgi:hypothetical protein